MTIKQQGYKGWSLVFLEDLAVSEKGSIRRGPFGGSLKKEIFVNDGYLVYEQQHAIADDFSLGRYFIDEVKYKEMEGFNVLPDDLIISCAGTIGKIAIAPDDSRAGIINQALMRIRPDRDKVLPIYLKRYLESPIAQREIFSKSSGSALKNLVAISEIKKSKIPLPPLEEQKRIVAILDKADRVRRKRQEAIRLTEELGRSIFLDMFGDPVTNPKGWEIVEIDQIVNAIESGWSPKCDSRIAEADEWGVLKLGAITWGTFNEQENKALLQNTTPKPVLEVLSGDLLFARKNTYELVGASVYVHQTRPKLLLPDLIFRLKVNNKVNPVYLWQALSQSSMRKEISCLASGSSGSMPNISKARLRTLKIPLPHLDMQNKYSEISGKFWKNQEVLKEHGKQSENLFNSLLQRAFRGEL